MEMLKLLNEAKASGLTKEEFFHLLELEVKLNANKKQVTGSCDDSGERAVGLEKLLHDMCDKLENQQQKQYDKLQQSIRDFSEQQKQQLQHQQEYQCQQLQHIKMQLQHSQQQNQQEQQKLQQMSQQQTEQYEQFSHGPDGQTRANVINFELTMQKMRDEFHEMRVTVLNRLEEEKIFMRNALSKAQNDILTLLSKTEEDVREMKEIIKKEVLTGLDKEIGQLQQLCEDMHSIHQDDQTKVDEKLQTQKKTHNTHQEDKTRRRNRAKDGQPRGFDFSECYDSPF